MAQPILTSGTTQTLIEAPESPLWEFTRDSGASVTRTFRASYAVCMANRPPVNAFGTGIYLGLRITEVRVIAEKLGNAQLIWKMTGALTANGQLPELPPDVVSCKPAKQEFRLEKHPRYGIILPDYIQAINDAISVSDSKQRADARSKVLNSQTKIAGVNIPLELLGKMERGETHYNLFIPVYEWTFQTLVTPVLDGGNYIQTPYGPLPPPPGWQWLREADVADWTGSYWKVTRTWQAGIDIDSHLYPPGADTGDFPD